MRRVQPISGAVSIVGPQPARAGAATTLSATALATLAERLTLYGYAGFPVYFTTQQVVGFAPGSEVYQGGRWSLKDITGAISLPTNAAKEEGGNLEAMVSAIDAIGVPPLGQAAMAQSLPVAIARDQETIYDMLDRRLQEKQLIEALDVSRISMMRRSAERYTLTDRRGSPGRGSTR